LLQNDLQQVVQRHPSRHTWVALPAPRQPECWYPYSLFLKFSSSHLIRDGAPSGKNLFPCKFPNELANVHTPNSPRHPCMLPSSSEEGSVQRCCWFLLPKSFPQSTLQQNSDHAVVCRILERVLKAFVVHVGIALEFLEQQVAHPAHLVLKPHRDAHTTRVLNP